VPWHLFPGRNGQRRLLARRAIGLRLAPETFSRRGKMLRCARPSDANNDAGCASGTLARRASVTGSAAPLAKRANRSVPAPQA
jgi:hypothetical protein